ncbi:MAG: HAD family phosphatase [Rhodobacter sp.]|nr:HAD family phosphatase [Rhodobacter sp.]
MYDAVIFDLDGTLIDSESITQAAGIEAFAAMGIDIDPAFLHSLIGVDDRTGSGVIRARFPQLDTDLFAKAWSDALRRRWDRGVPLKAGTQEVLSRIILPKALATSSTRLQADRKLMLTGLGVHFAQTVTVDDVMAPKPAPEPYLLAASLLGVDPARCVAFEDSETGARSAHAAGMTVVQIPDIVPTDGAYAHHVAPDLISAALKLGLI